MAHAPRSIEDQLRSFCGYQERCTSEVELKLRKLNVPRERWDELMEALMEEGFLDDARYARAYVRGKHRIKGWAKLRIAQGLQAKRLPRELIQDAIESEIDPEDYLAAACRLVEKSGLELGDSSALEEIQHKLQRKGYTWAEVQAAVDAVRDARDDGQ